ncbi:MAG: fibrillarin-like rRNA/tRNA 2'-O-methyltransferase [Candidatus Thermoplasmatota archaeon]|nr:fibrillarin-like rRNA/tRNA 2'-O-methyltransferase [Candidatus Thermoplasmatota archaeon]
MPGVYKHQQKLFTENLTECKGVKVYNEQLRTVKGKEFRSWNPYRSKLAAALLNGIQAPPIKQDSAILYLGAATGTTVSHLSDIACGGILYAIEFSPVAVKHLVTAMNKRINVVPVLADANHPDRYAAIVSSVDFLYQDISQRNQADIFVHNAQQYLKPGRRGIIMVKARSIDVSITPKQAYQHVIDHLKEQGLKIIEVIELSPYEKDHAAILVSI